MQGQGPRDLDNHCKRARMLRGTLHNVGVDGGGGGMGAAGGSRGSTVEGVGPRPVVDRTAVAAQYTEVPSREESTHTVVPEKTPKEKGLVVGAGRQARLVHRSIPPLDREHNGEGAEAERLPLS